MASQFNLLGTHLQGVLNTIIDSVNGKQAAEAGKGLSTNDFTSAYKTKLDGISAGAEVNQNAFTSITDGTSTIVADSKTAALKLQGDGATSIAYDVASDAITISSVNTTYSVGDGGLTQKNFTTALYNKLNAIEAGAQVNNPDFARVTINASEIISAAAGGSFALDFIGAVTVEVAESTASITIPDMTYSLPIATAAALGGVKVGSGLSINAGTGVLSLAAGYATETYVNTAVAAVIDAAPAALDTLNELAAALGDDANFATTVTNDLSTRVTYDYLGTAAEAIALLSTEGGLNILN
jgi:hypothetical protein